MDELLRPGNLPLSGGHNEKKPAGQLFKEKCDAAAAGLKKGMNGARLLCLSAGEGVKGGAAHVKAACVSAAGAVRAKAGGIPSARVLAEGLRKAGSKTADAVVHHPVSPLLYLTLAGLAVGAFVFHSTYIRAYAVRVDGVEVALVADTAQVENVLSSVEDQVSSIVGEPYDLPAQVTYLPVYSTEDDLTDDAEIRQYLYSAAAPDIDAYYASIIQACVLTVGDEEIGMAPSQEEMNALLDRVAEPYITSSTIDYGFVPDVSLSSREINVDTIFDLDAIYDILTADRVEQAVYVVQQGDTFSRIAKGLGMTMSDLSDLNPDVVIDKIWVGDELVIQRSVPYLSVWTMDDETYEQVIESPVEYTETDELYKGDTKVVEQGEDGVALVNAHVRYVNGYEEERTILSSQTLEEPTVTHILMGTKERPKTASKGSYIWPVSGKISSRYGNRHGEFHTGLDIAVPYGTRVKAADGGTVTYAGWKGNYGKLVIITHDNGAQTYYAHNSSLLVSVGDKVYQGQAVAKAGSTGRSTGNHCHFEIRIGGKTKNPLNYL